MKNKKLWVSIIAGVMAAIMVLSLMVSLIPRNASAVSSGELKQQLDALKAEKDQLTAQIQKLEQDQKENRTNMEDVMAQKAIIEQQISLLYSEITNVNDQISTYSLLIADKQDELEEAQSHLDWLTEQHRERLRAMEEEGELSYWSVIFKANSFSDLLDRVNMVKEIAAADQRRMEEMSTAAQEVASTREELETEKKALEGTRSELENAQKELDQKNAESEALLDELVGVCEDMQQMHDQFEAEEDQFLDLIAAKDKEYNDKLAEEAELSRQASIQASIQESIQVSIQESVQASIEASRQAAQATKPSKKPSTGGSSSSDSSSSDSSSSSSGSSSSSDSSSSSSGSSSRWLRPTAYSYVSSPFGYRYHPVTGKWTMHKGVDLVASKGTPIYASRSGYVTIATYHSTAGNYVTINHQDGYSSVYMHMTHDVVSVGEYVKAGELIGYVGSTGRSTGPHLHFGISYNGTYVNPMDYI